MHDLCMDQASTNGPHCRPTWSRRVSFELRKGTKETLGSARALMHTPRVVRERLMLLASAARSPAQTGLLKFEQAGGCTAVGCHRALQSRCMHVCDFGGSDGSRPTAQLEPLPQETSSEMRWPSSGSRSPLPGCRSYRGPYIRFMTHAAVQPFSHPKSLHVPHRLSIPVGSCC